MARRPKRVQVGPYRATPRRGPHPDRSRAWYWQVVRYDGSKDVTVKGAGGWMTRRECETKLLSLGVPEREPDARVSTAVQTVGDLLRAWWAEVHDDAALAESTRRGYRYDLRHLLGQGPIDPARAARWTGTPYPLDTIRLDRLQAKTVRRYVSGRLQAGAGLSVVRREVTRLRTVWGWGWEHGFVDGPFPRVRMPRPKRAPAPRPTRAAVEATLREIQGPGYTALLLIYSTGARTTEITYSEWEDYDLDHGTLLTGHRKGAAKSGARVLHLPETTVAHLREVRAEGRERPAYVSDLGDMVHRASARAGVPPFRPHAVRKLVEDLIYGAGPDIAGAIQGHTPEVALAKYRQVRDEQVRDAVRAARLGIIGAGEVIEMRRKEEG